MNRSPWRIAAEHSSRGTLDLHAVVSAPLCGFLILIAISLPAPVAAQTRDKEIEQRRARVEAMSAVEKETLRRNQQRFARLGEGQQQELRDLYAKISTGPDSKRLSSIMRLYHDWMQSLTAGERLELLALPTDQRVRAIKRLIERQERDRFQELVQKSLSLEDREAIINWLSEMALNRLPAIEQQRLREITPPLRQRMEVLSAFRRRTGGLNDTRFLERLNPSVEDRQVLIQRLSQSAQDALKAVQDDPEKRQLVQSWVNAAIFSRRDNRPEVAEEALEGFFAKLDASERDYLNNLPPDRRRDELTQLYMRQRMRRPGEFRPGEFRPGEGRPGEPPPPFGPPKRRRP